MKCADCQGQYPEVGCKLNPIGKCGWEEENERYEKAKAGYEYMDSDLKLFEKTFKQNLRGNLV